MADTQRFKRPFLPTIRRLNLLLSSILPSATRSNADQRPAVDPRTPSSGPSTKPKPACVALQNEDADEDAIIITALNVIPFCCHADLVTMPRPHLLAVAATLNAKLPAAMQIDVSPARSDAFVRNSIELLVGLHRDVPHAPKPVKSRLLRAHAAESAPASPSSPLATKNSASAGLPAVAEADEGAAPVSRKRKLEAAASPLAAPDFGPARRITRAQSHRVAPAFRPAAPNTRVLRTQSQRVAEKVPDLYNHPNVTVGRGRRSTSLRHAAARASSSGALTSTPKRRKTFHDIPASPKSVLGHEQRSLGDTKRGRGAVRRTVEVDTTVDTTEVTFGIDGMTMAVTVSSSDMDLSSA